MIPSDWRTSAIFGDDNNLSVWVYFMGISSNRVIAVLRARRVATWYAWMQDSRRADNDCISDAGKFVYEVA
jgi:hypothetical protein